MSVLWPVSQASLAGLVAEELEDGRYVADSDGPQEVNGFFQVHTSTGDAPNPLWQFDGSVDLLTPISRLG